MVVSVGNVNITQANEFELNLTILLSLNPLFSSNIEIWAVTDPSGYPYLIIKLPSVHDFYF